MSRILECFDSRYGEDGVIIEADFSQLEIVALAILSDDKQLKEDLKNGIDMHCMNASFLYGNDYEYIKRHCDAEDAFWIARRKAAKAPGFLIQYGGGATLMAKETGLKKSQCQKFIDEYYNRYTGVKWWQQDVAQHVKQKRLPTKEKFPDGTTIGKSVIGSLTGRRYAFFEMQSDWKEGASFSPTQIKNYPVQGFATGDIVPMVLGELFDALAGKEGVHLINTVHDSIILDCKLEEELNTVATVEAIMKNVPSYLREVFDVHTDVEFNVEIRSGKNWAEAKGYI